MSDPLKNTVDVQPDGTEEKDVKSRREFLRSLGKWSAIIIGGTALGSVIEPTNAAGWVNGGGGAWVNARGGGGGWVNASGGGGSWVNRAGGWINGGGAWVNARGGGGGSWVNRH